MRPDRFSVFGYAHVPTFKKHQRKIDEAALPDGVARHARPRRSPGRCSRQDIVRIGLDHFALPGDNLALAGRKAGCDENFRDTPTTAPKPDGIRRQRNRPDAARLRSERRDDARLLHAIAENRLATVRGYAFTGEDRFRADIIERVMCDMAVDISKIARSHDRDPEFAIIDRSKLESLIADGAVTIDDDRISVSNGAEFLVRSVASAFDAHLARSAATHSRAV